MPIERSLPSKELKYDDDVPLSSAVISPTVCYLGSVLLNNHSVNAVIVTLSDASGNSDATINVEGRDQWAKEYPHFGWSFENGLSISADTASAVKAHIFGVKKFP